MKGDADHVGDCSRCGRSLGPGDQWLRWYRASEDALVLECADCYRLSHPDSAFFRREDTYRPGMGSM